MGQSDLRMDKFAGDLGAKEVNEKRVRGNMDDLYINLKKPVHTHTYAITENEHAHRHPRCDPNKPMKIIF